MSSLPKGQWIDIACFSTSLAVLKAFMQPFHSHKNGKAGLGLGTVVTLKEEVGVAVVVGLNAADKPADVAAAEVEGEVLFGDSGDDKEEEELPLT